MKRLTVTLLVVAAALACSSNRSAISVIGKESELFDLAGEWRGTYESEESDRHGTIEFSLAQDSEIAVGGVVMFSGDESGRQSRTGDERMPQRLSIRFVQLGKGWVSGRLDPYEDPDCKCLIETLFQGKLEGDTVSGSYTAYGVHESFVRHGKWRIQRTSGGASPRE